MKTNQLKELKNMNLKELKEKEKDLKKEIANLVMDKNMNKLKDLKSISKKRKNLAQILTVQNQKQAIADLEPKLSETVSEVFSKEDKPKRKVSKTK